MPGLGPGFGSGLGPGFGPGFGPGLVPGLGLGLGAGFGAQLLRQRQPRSRGSLPPHLITPESHALQIGARVTYAPIRVVVDALRHGVHPVLRIPSERRGQQRLAHQDQVEMRAERTGTIPWLPRKSTSG